MLFTFISETVAEFEATLSEANYNIVLAVDERTRPIKKGIGVGVSAFVCLDIKCESQSKMCMCPKKGGEGLRERLGCLNFSRGDNNARGSNTKGTKRRRRGSINYFGS